MSLRRLCATIRPNRNTPYKEKARQTAGLSCFPSIFLRTLLDGHRSGDRHQDDLLGVGALRACLRVEDVLQACPHVAGGRQDGLHGVGVLQVFRHGEACRDADAFRYDASRANQLRRPIRNHAGMHIRTNRSLGRASLNYTSNNVGHRK